MRRLALAWLLVAGSQSCAAPASDGDRDVNVELGRRFVGDRAFRRQALQESLAVRDNEYARVRLANYALAEGWEQLPVWNPEVTSIDGAQPAFENVSPGEVAFTRDELLALGRHAFERWPAQRLSSATLAAETEHALVEVRYADGSQQLALTCASCHARVKDDGRLAHGPASDVDLAALLGQPQWGPGLVDVTADDRDNPVAIPDLRATRHQRRFHCTGNLYGGLASLAVRIETLLITAASSAVRPPREVAFALALYVWSLGDGRSDVSASEPGAAIFAQHCAHCHADATGAGDLAPVALVGTDPAATESSDRGSGGYRIPSLFRVSARTRLTHEGRFDSLDAMFDATRRDDDPAHPFGLDLGPSDRTALLEFLRGL